LLSPSSRRAWIEIAVKPDSSGSRSVALLAEGVDRNYLNNINPTPPRWSPSSRRAWIEMLSWEKTLPSS